MTDLDELIVDIHKVSEPNMFGTPLDKLLVLCEKLLVNHGYSVAEPIDFDFKIKSSKDLIMMFYGLLHHKYPETMRNHINVKKDLRLAKQMYESRMLNGVNKEIAFNECGEIIHTLFAYEKEFKLKYPIRDFGVLGQGNVGWITDKALQIMNSKLKAELEDLSEEKRKENLNMAPKEERIFGDLEKIASNMEGNNGQKEERH